ncbi:hypothetical protein C8Q77DRAFT_743390 [Trametes polyzona]|nr:hypothetical protein C8Q77DRAFT_743390 [Trametes polyzona]
MGGAGRFLPSARPVGPPSDPPATRVPSRTVQGATTECNGSRTPSGVAPCQEQAPSGGSLAFLPATPHRTSQSRASWRPLPPVSPPLAGEPSPRRRLRAKSRPPAPLSDGKVRAPRKVSGARSRCVQCSPPRPFPTLFSRARAPIIPILAHRGA